MKYIYMVLDSRAQFDIDRAEVMECCGSKKPSWKLLSEEWGEQGAVLVRYSHSQNGGDNVLTHTEIIGVIN